MADLRGYVTAAGQQFEALAKQMGYSVEIGMIEIGDGVLPDSESPIARTQLVNKIWSFPASVEQDPKNPGQWVAWIHIPPDHAINGQGYFIREIGCKLINQGGGILYAYRRVSNDWKPVDTSGEAKSFIYKLRFIPGNGELLRPTIDPSVVMVDREELEQAMKAHKESRDHPNASETAKGFTRYATQTEVNETTPANRVDAVVTVKTLWGWVRQASEFVQGMMKVATQQQTDTGADDDVAITPKKLRFGYSANFSANGYVALPSFLGGWIIQWGRFNVPPNAIGNMVDGSGWDFALPISFPTTSLVSIASFGNPNTGGTGSEVSRTKIYLKNSHSGIQGVNWLAIGK